jgi:predicted lipoprotein with Yx(FWY)xxD motif
MAIAAALAIGACGGGGGASSSDAGSSAAGQALSVQPVSGVGRVLVAQGDKAVYTSNVEANGKIACSGACNAFWKPVAAAGAHPSGGNGTGKLGVITRPDGTMQLTANGKPLYTFSEDSAGKASGDGFKDDFSGHHFTWHLVRAGGTTSSGSQQSNGGSAGGGGTPYGGSGGGY